MYPGCNPKCIQAATLCVQAATLCVQVLGEETEELLPPLLAAAPLERAACHAAQRARLVLTLALASALTLILTLTLTLPLPLTLTLRSWLAESTRVPSTGVDAQSRTALHLAASHGLLGCTYPQTRPQP